MELKLKLHRTEDELPERSGYCLCAIVHHDDRLYWTYLPYSAEYGLFNAMDSWPVEKARRCAIGVDFWAEVPSEITGGKINGAT